eukprot:6173926-Pleurochrysis_carterae.AAC.5
MGRAVARCQRQHGPKTPVLLSVQKCSMDRRDYRALAYMRPAQLGLLNPHSPRLVASERNLCSKHIFDLLYAFASARKLLRVFRAAHTLVEVRSRAWRPEPSAELLDVLDRDLDEPHKRVCTHHDALNLCQRETQLLGRVEQELTTATATPPCAGPFAWTKQPTS